MKKVYLLFITILCLLLTSCMKDTTQLAKDEFSKYFNGKDEVVLIKNSTIHFEKYSINLDKVKKDEESNNGVILKKDKLYFTTSKSKKMFDFTLNIYESNLDGSGIKTLFSKEHFKTDPYAYGVGNVFFIEHFTNNGFDENSRQIDKYTLSDGIYETIAKGKECSITDYFQNDTSTEYDISINKKSSSEEHGSFTITSLKNKQVNKIDDLYLENTIYIESMKKFNYGPREYKISNNHILLDYAIGAGNGWGQSHLVFEYDFYNNTLEYKLLAFTDSSVTTKLVYLV